MTDPTRSGEGTRRAAPSEGTQLSETTDYRPSSSDSSAAQGRELIGTDEGDTRADTSVSSVAPPERLLKLGTRARAQLDPELGDWMREVEKQLAETFPSGKEPSMHGHWMKPALHRTLDGGDLLLGPVQFNWFNNGFRIHVTWPFRNPRTVTLWQK